MPDNNLSSNNLFLGKSITLSKRLRWVQCPSNTLERPSSHPTKQTASSSSSSSKKDFQYEYWPGIIYKSYREIREDVKIQNSQFLKYCTVGELQYRSRKKQKQQLQQLQQRHKKGKTEKNASQSKERSGLEYIVAVVFFGNTFALRTFNDPKVIAQISLELDDGKDPSATANTTAIKHTSQNSAIRSFWGDYDKYYDYGLKHINSKYPQFNFQNAMDKVLSLLEEEIGNDPEDGQFVILDSFYSDNDCNENHSDKKLISPDGFDYHDEDNKDCNSDNDDIQVVGDEHEQCRNHEHRAAKEEKKKNIARSITCDFPKEQDSVKDESASSEHGANDEDDESSTSSQEFGDDGVVDDGPDNIEDESLIHDGETGDDGGHSISSSDSAEDDSVIKAYEPWHQVWEKFKLMGWNWKMRRSKIGLDERAYYKTDGSKVSGQLYWNEMELKHLAEKEHGWKDPEKTHKPCTPKKKRKLSPTRSDKMKAIKKQKSVASDAKSSNKQSKSSKVKPSSKQRIWGKETKVQEIIKTPPVKLNFSRVWKYLRSKGWNHINSRNPLHDWCYLKPNVKHDRKTIYGVEGEDYFISSDSLLEYLRTNDHYLCSPSSSDKSNCDTSNQQGLKEGAKGGNSGIHCTQSNYHDDDCDETMEDPNDSFWWLYIPIPNWQEIRPIVMKMNQAKMLKLNGNHFTVPFKGEERTLTSVKDFRQFLCSRGMSMEPGEVLDEDDLLTLSHWISVTHLPLTVDGVRLESKSSLDILPDVPILDCQQAWTLLCQKFNCRMENNQFHVPCIKKLSWDDEEAVTCFDSIEDARKYIRSHGIDKDTADDRDHVSIILWASLADVNPFHFADLGNEEVAFNESFPVDSPSLKKAKDAMYEKCWWLQSSFPQFGEVWKVLKRIVKYNKRYVVTSNGRTYRFDSSRELQRFLVLKGIEITPEHELSNDERDLISRWLSITYLPTRINENNIYSLSERELRDIDPMDNDEAWTLLCSIDYGSTMTDDQFFVPRLNESPYEEYNTYFVSIEDVKRSIRSHGIERIVKTSDNVDHVRLILWASLADVDPFIELPEAEKSFESAKTVLDMPNNNKQQSNDLIEGNGEPSEDSDENTKSTINEQNIDQQRKLLDFIEAKDSNKRNPTIIATPAQLSVRDLNEQTIRQKPTDEEVDEAANIEAHEEFFDNQERKEQSCMPFFTQEESDLDFKDMIGSYESY